VLALVSGDDPCGRPSGHPSYVIAHALAAQAAGFEPHIFCVSAVSELERTAFATIHRLAAPTTRWLLAPAYYRRLARAVAEYLETAPGPVPHVIHGFGMWAQCAASAQAMLARRGVPAVVVASAYATAARALGGVLRDPRSHGDLRFWMRYARLYPWTRTVIWQLERHGYRRAQAVLVNYESVARVLRESHGTKLNIRRIPYAAPAAFSPEIATGTTPAEDSALHGDTPLIVSVSRHDPPKGLDVLLRALAALRTQGIRFRARLVGPGHLLAAHRRLADQLELSDLVEIPGQVDDVFCHLRDADVFVLPSLREVSGSISVLEAMQAGKAIVASAVDGIAEDLEHERNALLVPPGDARALAQAISRLLGDWQLRAMLGSGARTEFEQRFSAQAMVRGIAELYAELGVST
jgi:glycosyltransferase involved in cell wall biosynthesis